MAHAAELNNPVPKKPLVFMKPGTALLINDKPFYYPGFTRELHYEVEIVLRICKNGRHVQPKYGHKYYDQVAVGIDFTARDIQRQCKEKRHPWEIAKGFDGSAPLSQFISLSELDPSAIEFELEKNGAVVQHGNTRDLIFSFEYIIAYVSSFFKLQMGDLIFTGTPEGVGPVKGGDKLEGFIFLKNGRKKVLSCELK